jgi:16S rRNA (guanine527-N7)-methyltransferase
MEQRDQIARYIELLTQYAGTLNLISQTALSDIDRKIADAKAYAMAIGSIPGKNTTVIDIGSGAGLPGVMIAAALPEYSVHLVERRKKRANFLKLVISQLELTNCRIWDCDINYVSGFTAAYITALAVGKFADLYTLSCHLHADTVTLISRKGDDYSQEIFQMKEIIGRSVFQTDVTPLLEHGRLVTIRLEGGVGCQ